MAPEILVIGGPTASGKSKAALSIAQKHGGVIINADSQQLYRELPILTARPDEAEQSLAPHKLYGILGLSEPCSAGAWLKLARMEIDWALGQGRLPIVVGGTGLYLKALLHGIADMPAIAPDIRAQAVGDYEEMGKDAFSARLREIDPAFFTRLSVFDRQRLIRAYEVWLGSGKTLSWWQSQGANPPYPPEYFNLYQMDIDRETLYRNCDQRFIQMVERGAVEDVRALLPICRTGGGNIIGFKELTSYIHGEIPLETAITRAQQATRNYAKRQTTWFRTQWDGAIVKKLSHTLLP